MLTLLFILSFYVLLLNALQHGVEPGFVPLSPNEVVAARPANTPNNNAGNNARGGLPNLPNFNISFQAPKDTSVEDAKRLQRQKEEEQKRKQKDDELSRKRDELKRKEEDLKRKQEAFNKKQEEEKKKRQEADDARKKKQQEEAEAKKNQQPQRRAQGSPPSPTTNISKPSPSTPSNSDAKKDPSSKPSDDKKEKSKEEENKKTNQKPKVNPGRTPLPRRYEIPKGGGIGGKLGGSIPDPGMAINPDDLYKSKSAGYALSVPTIALIAPLLLALLN